MATPIDTLSLPQPELYNDTRIFVIDCEGVIGAGKSTLCEQLAKALQSATRHVIFLPEPLQKWEDSGMLEEFYRSPPLMAFPFQLYTFSTRIGPFARAYRKALDYLHTHPDHTVLLLSERSPWGDRLFKRVMVKEGHMTQTQSAAYEDCHAEWQESVNTRRPDLVLWLRTEPATALGRVTGRARPNEKVSPDYMAKLHAEHVEALGGGTFEGAAVLTVDGAPDFRNNQAFVADLAARVWRGLPAQKLQQ